MADELDLLQEQEEMLYRLHIQAARRQLSAQGISLDHCERCGNPVPAGRQKAIPGVRVCAECQRVQEIHEKHCARNTR